MILLEQLHQILLLCTLTCEHPCEIVLSLILVFNIHLAFITDKISNARGCTKPAGWFAKSSGIGKILMIKYFINCVYFIWFLAIATGILRLCSKEDLFSLNYNFWDYAKAPCKNKYQFLFRQFSVSNISNWEKMRNSPLGCLLIKSPTISL